MTTRFIHNDRHTGATFPQTEPSNPPEPAPSRFRTDPRLAWLRAHYDTESNGGSVPATELAREMSRDLGESMSEADAVGLARVLGARVYALGGRFLIRMRRREGAA